MPIPSKIRQGDFVQWDIPSYQDHFGNSISSPDWSVTYYLRTNSAPIGATVTSTAFSDGFKFQIASNVTQTFIAGDWYYQAVADKSGAEKQTIISGSFKVLEEYKIGTRNAKKYELSELLVLKSQLKVELVREKQAETIANGLGNPRATFVRFDGAY